MNFFKYNNTVPIVVSLLLLSAGGAYAATNPDAILSQEQEVVSVDNTYIVNKDLASYTPTVRILSVTEDTENYTLEYTISSIDVDDYVWKDIVRNETMTVAKAELRGGDLGLYVTRQFKNIIDNQLSYLRTVQDNERTRVSRKVVSTTYGGLIGKLLDDTTETLPGYVPVVTPPPQQVDAPASNTASVASADTTPAAQQPSPQTQPEAPQPQQTSSSLTLQVLGNNPANIALRSSYSDLGAVVIDARNPNLGYYTYQNGNKVDSPIIDTSKPATFIIEYRATDADGVVVTAQRTVLVAGGEPAPTPEPVPVPEETQASSTQSSATPDVSPTPAEEPQATSTAP